MKQPFLRPSLPPRKPVSRAAVGRAITLVAATLLLLFIYYLCTTFEATAQICVIAYMGIPAALLVAYIIYNRGFVYKDVTADRLPATMSDEEKTATLEESRRRMERSKWMLTLLVPFLLVLLADALYLYVWCGYLEPLLKG